MSSSRPGSEPNSDQNSDQSKHYDVAIVGAGPVGIALALALAQSPMGETLSIALIESKPPQRPPTGNSFDTRVLAINEKSRYLLDTLVDKPLFKASNPSRVCPYYTMEVWDSSGNGHIRFDCAELHHDSLGHIIEQSVLNSALLGSVAKTPCIDFLYPQTLVGIQRIESSASKEQNPGDIIHIQLDAGSLTTALLIGADGGHSRARELLGIHHQTKDTGHTAIVAAIQADTPHGHCTRQWFSRSGPLAFLPLQTETGDTSFVSIVWSQHHQRAKQLMELDEKQFCEELQLACEHSAGTLKLASPRITAPLVQSHALDYVQAGAALLGDAAHAIHPLAGQGVNLGFSDGLVLVDELNRAFRKGLPINHPLALSRYQRRRKLENRVTELAMDSLKTLFQQENLTTTLLRNQGMRIFDKTAAIKRAVIKRAMGLH